MSIDPITLTLLEHRLNNIAKEMGTIMRRSAVSPIFSICHDFSCFLTDRYGFIVAQSDGLPVHTGAGGFSVRRALEYWSEDLNPDDVIISNDPYFSGGSHLPDWTVMRPVFQADSLVGFACNRAHMVDIGSAVIGSYDVNAKEIYQEGTRLPPLKLVDQGEVRRDLQDLLLLNTRARRAVTGDLNAMLGSTKIGHTRILDVWDSLPGDAEAYMDALLSYSERMMRSEIEKIPNGTYEAVEWMNNNVESPTPVEIHVVVTISGDEIEANFEGSAPQLSAFKNSPLANTHSAVCMAISMIVDPNVPHNEGAYRAINVVAPAGSVVNPVPPAPVTYATTSPFHDIAHACLKAIAQANPDAASAGWGKVSYPITSGYVNGEPYVIYHWNGSPGAGAVRGRDGFDQLGAMTGLGGLILPDLEEYEMLYPLRFIKHEFRVDAAGAGCYRGGAGIEYIVQSEKSATWIFRSEGVRTASGFGVAGGNAGKEGENSVRCENDESAWEAPQYGILELGPCTVRIHSPAGGGWGNPLDRDPKKVQMDIADGLVSRAAAETIYGVVLLPESLDVDLEATKKRREKLTLSQS